MNTPFNLEKEIQTWCNSIHKNWLHRDAKITELKDHLYCEIECLQRDELTDEEAFYAATKKLGNATELRKENNKNHGVLSLLFSDWSDFMNPQTAAKWNVISSIAVAITIVISTLILELSPYAFWSQPVMYALILLWLIPYTKLSHASTNTTIKEDAAMIKQKVAKFSNR